MSNSKEATKTVISAETVKLFTDLTQRVKGDIKSADKWVTWAAEARAMGVTVDVITDKSDTKHCIGEADHLTGKQVRQLRDDAIVMAYGAALYKAYKTPAKERSAAQTAAVADLLPKLGTPRNRINKYLSGDTATGNKRGAQLAGQKRDLKKRVSEECAKLVKAIQAADEPDFAVTDVIKHLNDVISLTK